MADDRPDDVSSADPGARQKRPPPTIDLDAFDVSGDTQTGRSGGGGIRVASLPVARLLAGLVGAIVALAVLGILWAAGVLDREGAAPSAAPATTAQLNALSDRVAEIERKVSVPTPDTALRARIDALEAAVSGVRSGVLAVQKQADTTSAAVTGLKSAPQESASPDVSALTERIARLEQSIQTLSEKPPAEAPAAADDIKLRRLAVADALEAEVRGFAPYADALALAKGLADDKAALAPLDAFASSGIPTDAMLAQDLLVFLEKLSPPAPKSSDAAPAAKPRLIDRIAAEAAKLVRIERVDDSSAAPAAVLVELQPVAEAARRNDIALAKDRLEKLPANVWREAQPWFDKLAGREAALKAAAVFTAVSVAALAKPAN
jgi:hypothetical protein